MAAHSGGFLPSYSGRSDQGCPTRPDLCPGGTHGPIKKKPSDYMRDMYYSSQPMEIQDREALEAWLRNPDAVKLGSKMPNYDLTEEEIDALGAALELVLDLRAGEVVQHDLHHGELVQVGVEQRLDDHAAQIVSFTACAAVTPCMQIPR